MTRVPHEALTQAEFPAWAYRREERHEFVDSHVYRLAGSTFGHANLAAEILAYLQPRVHPCRAIGSNILIETPTSCRYANVVVTGDKRDFDPNGTVIRFPRLIVEVISDATADIVLGPKMREYQAIPSLEEFVAVDSRMRWAQIFRRKVERWYTALPVTGGRIELCSVGLTIDLDKLNADSEAQGSF